MKKILKLFVCFLLLTIVTSATPKAGTGNYTVTVKGYVFGIDKSQSLKPFPLAGAKIELVDSDADGSQLFDDVMATAIVNPDGSFEVTGTGGDPGDYSWSRPDVYVRFVYNYKDKVRLTDELNRTRYANTPEHDHDNFEGVLDIGTWEIGMDLSDGDASKCGIWRKVCNAWDDYVSITGEEPQSGYCDIEYWSGVYSGTPWTNENTIHWPLYYNSRAAKHEFGHLIRHSFDGDRDHFNWDVTRFRYARNHSPCYADCSNWPTESVEMNRAFAFNEGWAEFWDNDLSCSAGFSTECEGGVAFILKNIEDSLRRLVRHPRKFMCQVLKDNPGSIHSIQEYISKMNFSAERVLYTFRKPLMLVKNVPQQQIMQRIIPKEKMISGLTRSLNGLSGDLETIDQLILAKRGEMQQKMKRPEIENNNGTTESAEMKKVEQRKAEPAGMQRNIPNASRPQNKVKYSTPTMIAKANPQENAPARMEKRPTLTEGEPPGIYAMQLLDITAMENKRSMLQLQQEAIQKSIDDNYYDQIPQKIMARSFEPFYAQMRTDYNQRINEQNIASFKDAIERLQQVKDADLSVSELIDDLQKKLGLLEQQINNGNVSGISYKPYDGDSIKKL
ncbi:MAG: hypothetical protein ABIN67_14305 [Ferruginibacter sp.]